MARSCHEEQQPQQFTFFVAISELKRKEKSNIIPGETLLKISIGELSE